MQGSVPSPARLQATMCATLFDEWIRCGLRDVVVCPGSRSTPLVLAAGRRDELSVHVRLDERSAAFFALGVALATSRPVAVVVTSGTAVAELHAAVAEADLAFVPLLVVTADRPPELRGVGAAQTIDQRNIFGPMVRRGDDPGVARADARATWRPLAARLWVSATSAPAGPVHLNLPFVEPLIEDADEVPPSRGDDPWVVPTWSAPPAAELEFGGRRVLCVVGAGVDEQVVDDAVALDWVVIGDATAHGSLAFADALLRDERFAAAARPDVVVRLGGMPASRVLAARVVEWAAPVVALTTGTPVADPDGVVGRVVTGRADVHNPEHRGDAWYAAFWTSASTRVGEWLDARDAHGAWDEPRVAREVVAAATRADAALVVGSSMPVRDVEWWTPPRATPTYANRGANGIDGVVSTALGVAVARPTIALVGDLTFLHDLSALVDGVGDGVRAVVVVSDNGGGGIFSFLAQGRVLDEVTFERFFATPRRHDLVAVARALGHEAARVGSGPELAAAIAHGLSRDGLSVVVADVGDRGRNVAVHDEMVAGVAAHWESP